MKPTLIELFAAIGDIIPVVDWLDLSSYDELIEIDVPNDRYRIINYVQYKDAHAENEGNFSEMVQFAVDHLVYPEDRDSYLRFVDASDLLERLQHSKAPGVLIGDFRFKIRTGEWRWVQICLVSGEQHGLENGIVRLYTFDIQIQKERMARGRSSTMATTKPLHDDKTGLLWDRSFFVEAARHLADVDASEWCVIAIDMDHFSLFNDWYGRETGDLLLKRLGEELAVAEDHSGGVAGYLGQDDFCLVAPYDTDRIANLYSCLCGLITELTSAIGFKPIFGICRIDPDRPFMDNLDHAKLALDSVRADFRTDIRLYEPAMQEKDEREYRVLLEFQRALAENEFTIYLQPQCRISSGKIIGVEALVRWQKPDGSVVPPADFIPALEKHGFITDLDCYVWDMVCGNLRAWIDLGNTPIPVSVNVSQKDFYIIDVAEYFENLVSKYKLDPSLIKIEITESAFAENSSMVTDVVERLRANGFMVLMDDFGSGYSSLNRLGNLNLDVVKLDAAFLQIDDDARRKGIRIVESVVNMTKTLDIPIICEGVETKEQVEFLKSLGCRYVQGFFFYRPMSVDDFEALIGSGAELDVRGLVMKQNEQFRIREFLDENMYSDAMLNNILGPVALYSWNGDNVDIVRFNQQFYETVGVPDFSERLDSIQSFVPQGETKRFMELFERAVNDPLNGSSDIIGFHKSNGALSRFLLRMYYLGDDKNGKRFYGSARDVTELTDFQSELAMLSESLSTSILYLRRLNDRWKCKAIIHGLTEETGRSFEQFQQELDDGSFLERIDADALAHIRMEADKSLETGQDFSGTFSLKTDDGTHAQFKYEAKRIEDSMGEVSFIVNVYAA